MLCINALPALQARLAALQLPQMAADLAATTAVVRKKVAATQRGITNKRNRGQQLPSRQSARTRGEAPDPSTAGGIDFEARDGRVVLAAFVPERYAASTARPGEPAAVIRPPPEPFAFASSNGGESTDGAFLQQLQEAARVRVGAACECPSRATKAMGADAIMQLQLQAVDVAKLTTQGVSCMAFHPTSSKPLIAAADKSGKVRSCLVAVVVLD